MQIERTKNRLHWQRPSDNMSSDGKLALNTICYNCKVVLVLKNEDQPVKRGSRASLKPSPAVLNAKAAAIIAKPGKADT